MKSHVVSFPFDLYGSGGAAEGVQLVAAEFDEILADNRRETVPTRARAYTKKVRRHEVVFESMNDIIGWRETGRLLVRPLLDGGEFFIWVTGNHLGALPVYDELVAREGSLVVQLDAHLDIHNFADCTKELSHGNFLLHMDGTTGLINVGHRELLLTPDHINRHFRKAYSAAEFASAPTRVLREVTEACQPAQRVVLDIDWDVLDAVFFPAVTQPVPFGLTPHQLLGVIDAVWSERICGVVLSEFHPAHDDRDRSLALVMWLLESLLLRVHE